MTKPTTIDEILDSYHFTREDRWEEHKEALVEAKRAIYNLINREVIGEDGDIQDEMTSDRPDIVSLINHLNQFERAKLRALCGVEEETL